MEVRMRYSNEATPSAGANPDPAGATSSCAFQMQRIPELRFSATVSQEPEIELALV